VRQLATLVLCGAALAGAASGDPALWGEACAASGAKWAAREASVAEAPAARWAGLDAPVLGYFAWPNARSVGFGVDYASHFRVIEFALGPGGRLTYGPKTRRGRRPLLAEGTGVGALLSGAATMPPSSASHRSARAILPRGADLLWLRVASGLGTLDWGANVPQ